MRKLYPYVGPPEIAAAVSMNTLRAAISSHDDIRRWVSESSQLLDATNSITATFVIDADGILWIADRRSEHIACSRGGRVLSAGEITLTVTDNEIDASYITNQSTGYCPQPASWPAVAAALDSAGIDHLDDFDVRCEFRRCVCGQINLVKNEVYECDVCGKNLSHDWNLDEHIPGN